LTRKEISYIKILQKPTHINTAPKPFRKLLGKQDICQREGLKPILNQSQNPKAT